MIRIATEGEVTEPEYFRSEVMGCRCSRIRIEVLPTKMGFSSPQQVFERLRQSVLNDGALEADQYWIVADVDHYSIENRIGEFIDSIIAFNEKFKLNFQFAISNPRFEVWLALHKRLDLESKSVLQIGCLPGNVCKKHRRTLSKISQYAVHHAGVSPISYTAISLS